MNGITENEGKDFPMSTLRSTFLPSEMRDRKPAPSPPWEKKQGDDDDGPRRPKVEKPDTRELLRRMRKVDPNQSRRYRQRTGE